MKLQSENQVKTPARIQIKRAIFKALQDYQTGFDELFQFVVKQDSVDFLHTFDWKQNQRIVVLYLSEVENDGGYDGGIEKAHFSLFCAVSPSQNDDTIAFEALNFLAEQVRSCFWGSSPKLGFARLFPSDINLTYYSQFNFKIDIETRLSTESIVSHGSVNFSLHYQIQEYCDFEEVYGSKITVSGGCNNVKP